jgi:ferredoxin
MALLCRRKTLLYRELHGLGLRESYYSNGKFNRVIYSFDQFRVSRMGISKAVQMQPAVKKPSHEEMTKERLPEPRPFDLYRSICSSDRRGGAVAALEGWLNGGRKAAKWEPNRVISDPMKYKRDIHALQKRNFASESDKADENQQEANTETISVTFVDKDGEEKTIKVPVGMSMLEAAHENDIELEGACEGSLACSTCHVILMDEDYYNKLPEPTDEENDMLDLAFGLTEMSRLGCQVIAKPELDGMKVALPAATRNFAVDGYVPKPH